MGVSVRSPWFVVCMWRSCIFFSFTETKPHNSVYMQVGAHRSVDNLSLPADTAVVTSSLGTVVVECGEAFLGFEDFVLHVQVLVSFPAEIVLIELAPAVRSAIVQRVVRNSTRYRRKKHLRRKVARLCAVIHHGQ